MESHLCLCSVLMPLGQVQWCMVSAAQVCLLRVQSRQDALQAEMRPTEVQQKALGTQMHPTEMLMALRCIVSKIRIQLTMDLHQQMCESTAMQELCQEL